MALHYNLAKVYALSEDDPEFVHQILTLFVSEVPADLEQVALGIKNKAYQTAHAYAHKIKPTLDLLGLNIAYEDVLLIEAWAKREGKRREIKDTFDSVASEIEKAVKEIKKDFEI